MTDNEINQTLYVSTNGNDNTGTGDKLKPFRNIQQAIKNK
jgi:hypothetical protein